MAKRKQASEPVNEAAVQGQADGGIYLDPALIPIREAEAERNSVQSEPREDATLDPVLEKQRAEKTRVVK